MQFGDERESNNFADDTGRRGTGGFGGGGNMLGCLLPLIASRFGVRGVVILAIGHFLPSTLGGLGGGVQEPASQQVAASRQGILDPAVKQFALRVLASTEDSWTKLLARRGIRPAVG